MYVSGVWKTNQACPLSQHHSLDHQMILLHLQVNQYHWLDQKLLDFLLFKNYIVMFSWWPPFQWSLSYLVFFHWAAQTAPLLLHIFHTSAIALIKFVTTCQKEILVNAPNKTALLPLTKSTNIFFSSGLNYVSPRLTVWSSCPSEVLLRSLAGHILVPAVSVRRAS